jgi:FKBP-type peptidyl-prolyl cis-trans isomerase FkpA
MPSMSTRLAALLVALAFTACSKPTSTPVTEPPKTLEGGLTVQTLATGSGKPAAAGDKIWVLYKGTLDDGTVFDESKSRDQPFTFRLGRGHVIKGWDLGLEGMREGEKRKIVVPPALGYGGSPPGRIPPNSTLTFEVELLEVR